MAYIDDVLAGFSDYELSVFYKFRLQDYMQDTQVKIKNYIFTERGLTDNSIENFLSKMSEIQALDGLIRCPRCRSSKLQKDSLDGSSSDFNPEWFDGPQGFSFWFELKTGELQKYSRVSCIVCGNVLYDKYNEEQPSTRNFFKTLLRIPFGRLIR
jgi:predicted nucleic-acid-binding Zn-ribbon protein